MQQHATIVTLFQHNLWANTQLCAFCARLSDEQLDTGTVGTFGTIRATLTHIADAEYSYWHRIATGQPARRADEERPATPAALARSLQQSGAALLEVAPTVAATDSVTVQWADGVPRAIPSAVILTQVINHATEHRAQIMATLTQLGIEPPELDSWTFFDATSGAA
jgi:uncharacterized damage-inducible protein DinB